MARDDEFDEYERPVLPHERKADPGFRAGGLVSAGFEFAVVVAIFCFGGRWLDGWLGIEPWLTIILSMLGVAAAMTLLIRQVIRATGKGSK